MLCLHLKLFYFLFPINKIESEINTEFVGYTKLKEEASILVLATDEEFRKELSQLISFELKEPSVTGMVSVTKVKVTPDLKYAKVSVSILNSKNIKETLAGLKKSSGFLRSELAKRINLRNTPELVFELDESLEYGARIDKIINDLKKDNK